MLRGLYTAGSAMISNSSRINVVSNNLANVDTNSFKKDIILNESFEEILIKKRNGVYDNNNYSKEDFTYIQRDGKYELNAPNAFMKIDGKNEVNYSRSAYLIVDTEGYLATYYNDGNSNKYTNIEHRIYGQNGYIKVDDKELTFDNVGNVILDGVISDNILFLPANNVIGTINAGVSSERTETIFSQGQLERTDYEYDIAIDGEGFFEVETQNGNSFYTRDGNFKLNAFSELVTIEGYKVLGLNDTIDTHGEQIYVNHFGEIITNGETIDKIKIININNTYDLKKVGAGYYNFEDSYELDEDEFVGEIRQGYIEKSNSDSLAEMVTLLELYRSYESNQKMVSAYDSIMDKAVNEIGRL